MSVSVKICGIRTVEAAKAALDAGADFIGFNFVHSSRRHVSVGKAKEIRRVVGGHGKVVGVFRDESIDAIHRVVQEVKLDFVQLHGNESPEFCKQVKIPVIKAFSLRAMKQYSVMYYMVDREVQGSGPMLDLERLVILAKELPLFVAGGLTPENVVEVVRVVRPFAVDVASGIETDGVEDTEKIKAFVERAKAT